MKVGIALLMAAVLLVSAVSLDDQSDASSIIVTDGIGNTLTLDHPVDRIITVGTGITATVIGIGSLTKISVCDNYAYNNKDPIFDGLRELVAEGKVLAGGNIYSSGIDQLKKDIIYVADPESGNFDRENDVVVVTGSETYRNNIVPYLKENKFRNIMQWSDITEYDDIIGFAETVSMVCSGKVVKAVDDMRFVTEYVEDTLEREKPVQKDAFYVTFSANVFKVGNKGSLATSMIIEAGGNAFTVDPSQKASTYEANITDLVSKHPGCLVFVDNSIVSDQDKLKMLTAQVGDSAKLVPLQSIWNNYTLKSSEGLWTMACAMYPDLFEGDVPSIDDYDEVGMTGYFLSGLAMVCIVIGGSYLLIWRRP
ncbi:MAG: ABC transporter substrate-binding protein [Candidatus Methanomethylophilaceae archaeon]|nr:ABC transporter substrate-binding protein [Candidatus Methanomethylophilaceae archaeon]